MRIAGSTSMAPLLGELARTYSQQLPNVQFEIIPVGSSAGLELLRLGAVDMAAVSRELLQEEEFDRESGQRLLRSVTVARDAIAVVVHPSNAIDEMSLHVLQQVFEGRVLDWSQLRGTTTEVMVVSREDGSATRQAFEELVMSGHKVTPAAIVRPASNSVLDHVAQSPGAIGYVSMGLVGTTVKVLAVGGCLPSPEAVDKGLYPLSRPFVLVTLSAASSVAAEFSRWMASPAGQAIVAQNHGLAASPLL